jgi:hypothetical protein
MLGEDRASAGATQFAEQSGHLSRGSVESPMEAVAFTARW